MSTMYCRSCQLVTSDKQVEDHRAIHIVLSQLHCHIKRCSASVRPSYTATEDLNLGSGRCL